jgi:hypothetical protein
MEKFKNLCKKQGLTATDIGRMCYPELPPNRGYMKIHRIFTGRPKYVELRVIQLIADKLLTPRADILDMIQNPDATARDTGK